MGVAVAPLPRRIASHDRQNPASRATGLPHLEQINPRPPVGQVGIGRNDPRAAQQATRLLGAVAWPVELWPSPLRPCRRSGVRVGSATIIRSLTRGLPTVSHESRRS
jgi:hypothetical protein